MAFSKSGLFPQKTRSVAALCKALSHPARILIVHDILKRSQIRPSEMKDRMGLAQSTIAQHFKILRDQSIIELQEEFPHTNYRLHESLSDQETKLIKYIVALSD